MGTNTPTDQQREFLKLLFEGFPEFRIKTKIYRASRINRDFPRELKNKFVSGCRCFKDIEAFIKKRYDKGYKFILESNEEIECFDLYAFINYINDRYGKWISEFYQDEKEVIFPFRFPYTWFSAKKCHP